MIRRGIFPLYRKGLAPSLIIGAVLLSSGVLASADLEKARALWEQGETRQAGLLLKEALSAQPDDLDARLLLARVYLDLYQGEAAEKELRKALSAGASRPEVLVPMARALLLQGAYRRLLGEVVVGAGGDVAQRAELAALRGDAERQLGNRAAAQSEYARALALQPAQVDALLGQARLALTDRRTDEARSLLITATEAHPDAATAWEVLAEVDFARGDYVTAERSLVKAVIAARNDWMPRFKRALARLELGKIDAAIADIDAVAEEAPGFPGLSFARGSLLLRQGELAEGLAALDAYLKYDPSNVRALYLSAIGEMERGNLDLAEDLLQRYLEQLPDSVQANRAMGSLLLRKQNPSAAEALVRKALGARPDRPELLAVLAESLERQGRWDEALDPLLRVIEVAPDVAEYRFAAAQNLYRAAQYDAALAQLDEALALEPLHRAAPLLQIKILLEQQQAGPALALAQTLAKARRDDPYVLNALGLAQLAGGDEAAARASFGAAVRADPGFPDASLNLAKLHLRSGATADARRLLEDVVTAVPGHVEGILALAELDASGGDLRGQQRRLREAVDASPDEARFRLALARSYLNNGNPEQARIVVQSAPERMRRRPDLMLIGGQAQAATGDLEAAIETFEALRLKSPESATPLFLLAAVHAERGNVPAMEDALITAATMAPESPLLLAALDRGQALYKDPRQEGALLDRLLVATDSNPRLVATKADFLAELGEHERAEALMLGLFERYPEDAGVMRKLVSVQRAGNAVASAEEVLQRWRDRHPDDTVASVMLSQVQAELGKTAEARAELERLMESDAALRSDPLILNNLAWLLRNSDPERARRYAERALRSDPDSAAIKDTLGYLLVRGGDLHRGTELLREANQARPTDPAIGYHYAEALARLDRDAQARMVLLGVVDKDFPEQEAARALLAQLGD
jgi:putative PEP-CTERM system TPR-repeat lipoprotein